MPHWIDVLPQFLLACFILAALPGPATALFLQRSVRDGRAAGLAAVAGNEIGVFGWTLAGGAGLSVLLVANQFMNTVVHVLGALVLIWLGVQAWRGARRDDELGSTALTRPAGSAGCHPQATKLLPAGRTPGSAFRASLISIAANPKAAVFGLTILPQFLPSSGPVLPTVLILAGIQLVIDTAWCIGIVLAADRAGTWLRRTEIRQRVERALGAILVALGLGLAADAR
ncbi:LysE family translocator [Nocardia sp. NPDC049707]|uniref:LysE family translocator n=1 Tax=Nocardia sp. NPDC049707 TaxID=3154735 RepID=UPI003413377D